MEEGKCPNCGYYNLDYDSMEIKDNMVYYPWTCEDCNASGKEWYELNFIEQELNNNLDLDLDSDSESDDSNNN